MSIDTYQYIYLGSYSITQNNHFDVFVEKSYRAEAIDVSGSIIETYDFNVQFYEQPDPPPIISDFVICDNEGANDGMGVFALSTKVNEILNGQDSMMFDVSFHSTQDEAINGENPLSLNSHMNSSNSEEIFVRIFNSTTPDDLECYVISSFNIFVNLNPTVSLVGNGSICSELIITNIKPI